MKRTISNVCVIGNLTCMGCCGRDYTNRKELTEAIWKNTLEFSHLKDRKAFIERFEAKYLRECGVCRNVIFADKKKTKVMCPGHPAFNEKGNKADLREGHCEVEYLCSAARAFSGWNDEKKDRFIRFIQDKKLDWYDFSMGMDNDSLLKEFEEG